MSYRPRCDKEKIRAYLNHELSEDDLLDFLLHLDDCRFCRATLYEERKEAHQHFYRKASGKKLEKEMQELSRIERQAGSLDDDEITDVA